MNLKRKLATLAAVGLAIVGFAAVSAPASAAADCTAVWGSVVNTTQARSYVTTGSACSAQGTRAKFTPPGGTATYTAFRYVYTLYTYNGDQVWSVTSPTTPNGYVAIGGHARWHYVSAELNYYF